MEKKDQIWFLDENHRVLNIVNVKGEPELRKDTGGRRHRAHTGRAVRAVFILAVIAAAAVCLIFLFHRSRQTKNEVTVEADSTASTAEDSQTDSDRPSGTDYITMIEDTEPPVIEGVMTLNAFLGDPISYKSGITVTDDTDDDVDLEVDTSQVDMDTPGRYDITYTATDAAGNTTSVSTYLTINEKPDNCIDEEVVLEEASEVLDTIVTDDMSQKEVAYEIFKWVHSNITYTTTSDKDSWTNGAHTGFTEEIGDCFIYFSTAKALLTAAGIPNIDVVRSDTSRARHYWSLVNCGDGWYHFDTCLRADGGSTFMYTDEEAAEYAASSVHTDYYTFDHSLYPATPEEPFSMD